MEFQHSDLCGITDWVHRLILFTLPNILLRPVPYAEVTKKPWNPMLDSMNPVNLADKMDQPAQLDAPEAWVYGPKLEVWPYGLFTDRKMSTKVWVPCVYNYLPWGNLQLTINELDNL